MNKDITFGERDVVLDFSRWAALKKTLHAAFGMLVLAATFAIIILFMAALA